MAVRAQGYDISFLVTNTHMERMLRHKLIDFIIQVGVAFAVIALPPAACVVHQMHSVMQFMEEIDKEISAMKIAINARARIVASSYMRSIATGARV